MYCRKCGAKQLDDAVFCSECGTRLAAEGQPANPAAAQNSAPAQNQVPVTQPVMNAVSPEAAQKKKHRRIGVIAVIVAVVLIAGLVTLGVFLFGGRSYKSTVKQFMKAWEEQDAEAMIELLPEEALDTLVEDDWFDSLEEAVEDLQEQLEAETKYYGEEYGDWDISWKIIKEKDCSKAKLKKIQKELRTVGVDDVTEAKIVTIEGTMKYDELEETDERDVVVVKIGRSWYMAGWGDF